MSRRTRLDAVVDDARAEVRAQIAAGGRVRDFAAMIARAQELDPSAISEAARAEAADFASVVALGRAVEAEPPAPEPARTRRSATYGRLLGWAAALLLLGGGLLGAVEVARRELQPTPGAAVQHLGQAPAERAALPGVERTPTRDRGAGRRSAAEVDLSEETPSEEGGDAGSLPSPAVTEPADGHLDSDAAPVRESTERVAPAPTRRAAKASDPAVEPSWAALDREARAAWRRGDREAARALFAAIVTSDAERSRVELAYGDLMVLARLSGDQAELRRLRRAYLRRFPSGLYAEDAQAARCREAAPSCWRAYLERWPQGAHADEARRALAQDD